MSLFKIPGVGFQSAWSFTYPPSWRRVKAQGQLSFYPGFTLCCQVSGERRCHVPPHSPASTLSITSLSLPPDLAVEPPVSNRQRRKTRDAASRCWATACRSRNLSALDPLQLTCSRLQLVPRSQTKRGVRLGSSPPRFEK